MDNLHGSRLNRLNGVAFHGMLRRMDAPGNVMSSLVISLLIKEVVAARDVIRNLEEAPSTNLGENKFITRKLAASLKNYQRTCDEVRKITEERITGPLTGYEQERKAIRRYE